MASRRSGAMINSTMNQPHANAALGREPIRTIGRDDLKAKLDGGEDIKLIMALNRWAFDAKHIPGSVHFDIPDELYVGVRPDDEIVVYCSHVDCLSSVAWIAISSGAATGTFSATRAGCSTGKTPGCLSRATSRRHDERAAAYTATRPSVRCRDRGGATRMVRAR